MFYVICKLRYLLHLYAYICMTLMYSLETCLFVVFTSISVVQHGADKKKKNFSIIVTLTVYAVAKGRCLDSRNTRTVVRQLLKRWNQVDTVPQLVRYTRSTRITTVSYHI